MRYAFFSDVHGNLLALKAALKDMKQQKVDERIFLGDSVGYGTDPVKCARIIKKVSRIHIMGNHDYAAIGRLDPVLFNPHARWAIEWTREILGPNEIDFISSHKMSMDYGEFHLVHAAPLDPENWGYILTRDIAKEHFPYFSRKICLIGHSHIPVIFVKHNDNDEVKMLEPCPITIEDNARYIINIGSVGQPRDRNPDACYMIYDTDTQIAEHRRVHYNIKKTQKKMIRHKFPERLINRLEEGR